MNDTRYVYEGFICEFDMFSCREFKDMVKHYDLFHKSQRNSYNVMAKLSYEEIKRLKRKSKDIEAKEKDEIKG